MIRSKGYDFTQPGAYFVTLCVWQDLPRQYPHLDLGEFCMMPNHVLAIMVLVEHDRGRGGSVDSAFPMPDQAWNGPLDLPGQAQTHPYTRVRHGLPEIVRAFKSFSARRINVLRRTPGVPVWQRNYYKHIIRSEAEWRKIHDYITDNPAGWEQHHQNPHNL